MYLPLGNNFRHDLLFRTRSLLFLILGLTVINVFGKVSDSSSIFEEEEEISNGSFYLINSNTNETVARITHGDLFFLDIVGDSLNIQAVPNQTYDQIRFSDNFGHSRTEGVAPYAFVGDNSGNYYAWNPQLETYNITVEYLNAGVVIETDIFSITFRQSAAGGLWSTSTSGAYYSSGNVGINTSQPDTELTVNGNIHAKEIKVDLSVPAPDYVFLKDYELMSLKEVREYIEENGHLRNIPSAKDIEEDGIDLGIMNMKLLEKIEELTLYTLEQDQQLKNQNLLLKTLHNKVRYLEEFLEKSN